MTNYIPYVPRTYNFTLKVATKFPSSSKIDPQIVSFFRTVLLISLIVSLVSLYHCREQEATKQTVLKGWEQNKLFLSFERNKKNCFKLLKKLKIHYEQHWDHKYNKTLHFIPFPNPQEINLTLIILGAGMLCFRDLRTFASSHESVG